MFFFNLQYNATARERQEAQVHRIRSSSPMVGVPDATELDTARPQTAGNFLLNLKKVCLDLIFVAVSTLGSVKQTIRYS